MESCTQTAFQYGFNLRYVISPNLIPRSKTTGLTIHPTLGFRPTPGTPSDSQLGASSSSDQLDLAGRRIRTGSAVGIFSTHRQR
eukprot:scaffold81764_cov72-Phaeocystis_antarctica.AAC.1